MRGEERKQGYTIKASLIFYRKNKKQFAYHPQGQLLMPAIALSHGQLQQKMHERCSKWAEQERLDFLEQENPRQLRQANLNVLQYILAQATTVMFDVALHRKF